MAVITGIHTSDVLLRRDWTWGSSAMAKDIILSTSSNFDDSLSNSAAISDCKGSSRQTAWEIIQGRAGCSYRRGEPIIPLQVPWGVWMALSLLLTRVLLSWLAVLLPLGCLVTPPEHIIICVLHYKLEQRTFSSKGKFIITKLYYLTQSQIIIAEKLEVFYSMKIIAMQEKKMKNF